MSLSSQHQRLHNHFPVSCLLLGLLCCTSGRTDDGVFTLLALWSMKSKRYRSTTHPLLITSVNRISLSLRICRAGEGGQSVNIITQQARREKNRKKNIYFYNYTRKTMISNKFLVTGSYMQIVTEMTRRVRNELLMGSVILALKGHSSAGLSTYIETPSHITLCSCCSW